MQLAGSSSWRFAESVDQQLLLALWVRAALRLEVGAGPPRLTSDVPDRRQHLQGAISDHWGAWWQVLVADAVLLQDGRARPPGRPLDRAAVGGLVGLVESEELRESVAGLLTEAQAGADALKRAVSLPAGRAAFAWEVLREVAEDVAFDRAVELDRVRGVALVLPVDGPWWQLAGPGAVLCSPAAAADPVTGRAALRAAFETELTR